MKQTFKLLTVLASATALMALGLASCEKPEEENVKEPVKVTGVKLNETSKTVTEGATFTLTATVEPQNADDKTVTWSSNKTDVASVTQEGKVTALKAGTATITVTTKDGGKTATCAVTVEKAAVPVTGVTLNKESLTLTAGEEETLVATVAPADADNKAVTWSSSADEVATVSQEGKVTAVAAGTATITVTTQEGAKTATCAVTVEAAYVGVESVTVTPAEAPLTISMEGAGTITLSAQVLPADATEPAVTWSSDKPEIATVDEAGVVTAVATGTAVITAKAGEKTGTCTVTVSYDVPAFVGQFAITGTKIFGGTGPAYGGAALTDPTKKSVWSTNGSGPAAYNDDYVEIVFEGYTAAFEPYGKCIHWGGADGKEWNCTFLGVYNNVDPGYDKDCHSLFNRIPVGESKWQYNKENDAIVIQDKNGNVDYCKLLVPGSYPLHQDSSVQLQVEEGKFAIGFECTGKDDWNNTYTDYDMMVGRARNFFYIVQPVEAVPEDAKTEGVEIPEAGQSIIQAMNALGSWKVNDLWVVGGAKDRYTLDRVLEKTWCWNNYSCNKEKDNVLTIKPDGTANYDGKDNGYWDYKYAGKKAGATVDPMIDCSKWYGQIPHGDFSYSFDPETGDAVLGTGEGAPVARLMAPGTYHFWGIKKDGAFKPLTIGENQIGVRFVLAKKPSTDTSFEWTDYDRFVNSPLVYIMIFDKQ